MLSLVKGKQVLVLLFFVFWTSLAALPVLRGYYLHTDDYFWSHWGGFSCASKLHFLGAIGRPLGGLIYCMIAHVSDFKWMSLLRFLAVLNLAAFATLLFFWIRRFEKDFFVSLLIPMIVVTLPPFGVFASYLSTLPHGLAITVSLVTLHLTWNSSPGNVLWAGDPNLHVPKTIPWRPLFWPIFLLAIAISLNQVTGLYFIAALAIPLWCGSKNELTKLLELNFRNCLKVAVGGMALYYFLYRISAQLFHFSYSGKYDGRHFIKPFQIPDRVHWFLSGPIKESFNLWFFLRSYSVSLIVGFIVIGAFGLEYFSADSILRRRVIRKYLILLLLIPFCFVTSLVSSGPSSEYRTYPALASLAVFALIFGLRTLAEKLFRVPVERGFAILLFFIAGFGLCLSYSTLETYFSNTDSREFVFMRKAIADYIQTGRPLESIHIIRSPGPFLAPKEHHEIGEPSARHPVNVPFMVAAALSELKLNVKPVITQSSGKGDPNVWEEWVVHDYNKITFNLIPHKPIENSLIIDYVQKRVFY